LRKIVKGGADKSYGIQVAKLAGVPDSVINRAKEIVEELSENDITSAVQNISTDRSTDKCNKSKRAKKASDDDAGQMSLFDMTGKSDAIVDEILSLDISNLTPIEAINKLYELQNSAKMR
jgi:DNA mismatch repair protein MutS